MSGVTRGSVVVGFLDAHEWSACFGLSLRDMYLRDAVSSNRMVREGGRELRKVCGSGGIPDGRNAVVKEFLDSTDGEWLFFIDTDMGFAPDTVDRLLASADEHRRPVVGGLCFALRRVQAGPFHSERFGIIPTIYRYVETDDAEVGFVPVPTYPRDELVPVAGTGAACILIHRRALRKVRDRHGDAWFDTIQHPTGLRGKPRTFSEDLSFCVRLAGVGIQCYVDTSVKTVHHKGGVFLEEDGFLAQQEAAAAADLIPAVSA